MTEGAKKLVAFDLSLLDNLPIHDIYMSNV